MCWSVVRSSGFSLVITIERITMDEESLPLTHVNKRPRPTQQEPCPSPNDTSAHSPRDDTRRNYSTFSNPRSRETPLLSSSTKTTKTPFKSGFTWTFELARWLCPEKSPPGRPPLYNATKPEHRTHLMATITRRVILLVSVFIAVLAGLLKGNFYYYEYKILPEWEWDHNVYIPRNNYNDHDNMDIKDEYNGTTSTSSRNNNNRVSLIAQVVSSKQLERLTEISSRPNRAYARQWGVDFTTYYSGRRVHSPKACFDKVFVLDTIIQKQIKKANELPPLWPHSLRVSYDSIMLLPPDSIITELDKNLLNTILPKDKLVAIAGWNDDNSADGKKNLNSNSDIILFNLRHRHADAVTKLWWEMVLPVGVTCGANNDLGMLVTAIAMVMDPDESLDDLIQPLEETSDGFVGQHLIKCIPPSVPDSRSALLSLNIQESQDNLQETADAVCYRFYPKCEVL